MSILQEIVEKTKERVKKQKQIVSLESIQIEAKELTEKELQRGKFQYLFEEALKEKGISFICEVKKASPSKGVIAKYFPYKDIAKEYEAAGASAISVLTEPYYFQGNDRFLKEIAEEVKLPIIRKDFTVDEYMIYEAKVLGASAVLLICSILKEPQLNQYIRLADSMGLSALVEAHNQKEVEMAVRAGARIIGVNNRNLKDFTVDIQNSIRLRKLVPEGVIFVSESGVKDAADIRNLQQNGTDAVLMGEALIRSENKKKMLDELRG